MPPGYLPKKVVKDESFNNTIQLRDDTQKILISKEPYLLDETEYVILTKTRSNLSFWAYGIFMCAGGLFLNVAGKYFDSLLSNQAADIKNWELWVIVIALVTGIILKGISILFPGDRKKILKDIDQHFKTAQKYKGELRRDE